MSLKPCPFCGNQSVRLACLYPYYSVRCLKCDFYGPKRKREKAAIAAWNKRHEPA